MCELLIRVGSRVGQSISWQHGEVIIAMPDGHVWGRMEHKPTFLATGGLDANWPGILYVVKVPDMTVSEAKAMIISPPTDPVTGEPTRRSGMRLLEQVITPASLAAGYALGEFTTTKVALLPVLEKL